jgi:hypothetical protein
MPMIAVNESRFRNKIKSPLSLNMWRSSWCLYNISGWSILINNLGELKGDSLVDQVFNELIAQVTPVIQLNCY